MKKFAPLKPYLLWVLAFATVGTVLSFFGQHGSIGPFSAFLAPLLGPWSRCLDPNGVALRGWDLRDFAGPVSLTAVVLLSLTAPLPRNRRALEFGLKFFRYAVLAVWCLSGLVKVVVELS